jgi:hypothetical protein
MPIKFKCPHCQKGLSVKDHLAGKRAACPACKKVLSIPAPTAAAADVEALAAAALADEPAPTEAAAPPATVDVTCPFCDEAVHFSAELGGKQAPCPKCKKIIKVPMPAQKDITDWRKVENRGPSLAKKEEELPPVGAWGTAAKPATVSQETLEEAGALDIDREPLTVGQWIRRGLLAGAGIALVVFGWFYLQSYWRQSLQKKAIDQALAYVEVKDPAKKLSPEWAAEIYRALGECDLKANKAPEAVKNFQNARDKLRAGSASASERDALVIELALIQVDLAGNAKQVEDRARLKWEEVARQWRQTVQLVSTPEARVAAARAVCRKLIARNQWPLAADMARWLTDSVRPAVPAKGKKEPRQTVFAQPVALLLALHQPRQAALVLPAPKMTKSTHPATRLIHTENWPNNPKLEAARLFFAKGDGPIGERLECLLTVAVAAKDQGQGSEARACVDDAVLLLPSLKDDTPSPWLMIQWADLAGEIDHTQRQALTDRIADPGLRSWAQLQQYRRQADESEELGPDSWNQAVSEKTSLAHALALEAFARRQARQGLGSDFLNSIGQLEPEAVRPLGYVGVALGLLDNQK